MQENQKISVNIHFFHVLLSVLTLRLSCCYLLEENKYLENNLLFLLIFFPFFFVDAKQLKYTKRENVAENEDQYNTNSRTWLLCSYCAQLHVL